MFFSTFGFFDWCMGHELGEFQYCYFSYSGVQINV